MFFYNKSKILTILFIVKYEKITLFDEFLMLLGPIISRFFACSNEGKNKQKQQRVLALVLSLCPKVTGNFIGIHCPVQGDQKISKKICQIFQKIAQKVAKAKKAKIYTTKLNLKAQNKQITFETLKYLQQTML